MCPEKKVTLCPVCGYLLGWEDWEYFDNESCPCCCIEFGYHDSSSASGAIGTKEVIYKAWRQKWIAQGMIFSCGTPPPNWDPIVQLARIGVKMKPNE